MNGHQNPQSCENYKEFSDNDNEKLPHRHVYWESRRIVVVGLDDALKSDTVSSQSEHGLLHKSLGNWFAIHQDIFELNGSSYMSQSLFDVKHHFWSDAIAVNESDSMLAAVFGRKWRLERETNLNQPFKINLIDDLSINLPKWGHLCVGKLETTFETINNTSNTKSMNNKDQWKRILIV